VREWRMDGAWLLARGVADERSTHAMLPCRMPPFRAIIELAGINPFVAMPPRRLQALLEAAGRQRGPIPVRVVIGDARFRQNLIKYSGVWRLYLNTPMRAAAGKGVGDRIALEVEFDPEPRVEPMPGALRTALAKNAGAKATFLELTPSRRKEIQRYLNSAKTEATVARNVAKVIAYLSGEAPPGLAVLASRPPARRRA
jgi:hypothetical protein